MLSLINMKILLIFFLLPIIIYSSTNISIFAAADNSLYYTLNNNLESIRKGTENIDDITVFILADTPYSTYHIKIFNPCNICGKCRFPIHLCQNEKYCKIYIHCVDLKYYVNLKYKTWYKIKT